jgi:protein-disulfide isomerase
MLSSLAASPACHRYARNGALLLSLAALLFIVPAARAWSANAPDTTPIRYSSALKPPPGAKVAIVEFDDLECPACAEANPVIMQAVAKYKIPWIRHDFLIPGHVWSPNAAIYARWFDTRSKKIGSEYRNAVFANQPSINTRQDLISFTQKFAASHGLQLPFMVDPQDKLSAEVQADVALGKHLGVTQTPTIYIVMADSKGAPYIKVQNPEQDLFQDIDKAIEETRQ